MCIRDRWKQSSCYCFWCNENDRTVGWAIYPLGYIFGYLTGGVDAESLNVVYNLADFVNKIAFGLVIWAAATSSSGRRAK